MVHTSSLSIWEAKGLPQFLCHTELYGETQKKNKQTATKLKFYLNFSGALMQQNNFLANKG